MTEQPLLSVEDATVDLVSAQVENLAGDVQFVGFELGIPHNSALSLHEGIRHSAADQYSVDAFQKAGPFPNPPKGIVEDDGFVRIRWDFILKTEAAPRIQFQSSGNNPIR